MRIILDCDDTDDLAHCLRIARDALRTGEEGDVWGYWSQSDPKFSALIRFNRASISVRGRRKPLTAAPASTARDPSAFAGASKGQGSDHD